MASNVTVENKWGVGAKAEALCVDGESGALSISKDRVGVGTTTPGKQPIDEMRPLLDVTGYASFNGLRVGRDGVNDILSEHQDGLTLTAKGSDDKERKEWYGGIKFRTGENKAVRMRITPDGRVGVGIEKPAQDVRLSVAGHLLVQAPEGFGTNEDPWDEAILYLGDKEHFIKAVRESGIRLSTYGAEDALVVQQGTGRVGVGTTTPGQLPIDAMYPLLDVAGYASFNGLRVGRDGVNDILSENQDGLTLTAKGSDDKERQIWYGGIKFRTGEGKAVRMRITPDGRVGIGIEKPAQDVRLSVAGHLLVQAPEGFGTEEDPWDEAILYLGDKLHFLKAVRNRGIRLGTYGVEGAIVVQQGTGYVGIGRLEPETKLDVNGEIQAHDILLKNADCAEEFAVEDANVVEPGSVMVMNGNDALEPCCQAYDKRVVGVVSGAGNYSPGIVLDRQPGNADRLPIALMGKVFCKVDAQDNPIEVGDLLTTSATPGYAMKASDPLRAFGTVIGKALGSLASGKGLVPVLVALK